MAQRHEGKTGFFTPLPAVPLFPTLVALGCILIPVLTAQAAFQEHTATIILGMEHPVIGVECYARRYGWINDADGLVVDKGLPPDVQAIIAVPPGPAIVSADSGFLDLHSAQGTMAVAQAMAEANIVFGPGSVTVTAEWKAQAAAIPGTYPSFAEAHAYSRVSVVGLTVVGPTLIVIVFDLPPSFATEGKKKKRDPVNAVLTNEFTGEEISGDIQDVRIDFSGGEVGWQEDVFSSTATDLAFEFYVTSPVTAEQGSIRLFVENGMVVESEKTGTYFNSATLPGIGSSHTFSFTLPNTNTYTFAAPPGMSTLDLHMSGSQSDGVPSFPDFDDDGIIDDLDNCPTTYNPEQEDEDEDGIGDVCTCLTCEGDMNGDSQVDEDDVSLFSETILAAWPDWCADANQDGLVDGQDIQAFTSLVLANNGAGTPCE